MKINIKTTLQFVILLTLLACEKVITIDLDQLKPSLVINARINADTKQAKVKLSTSRDYYEKNPSKPITNALIKVVNLQSNQTQTLSHVGHGEYSASIQITDYALYSIEVLYQGTTYKASSQLFPKPSILQSHIDAPLEDGSTLSCIVTDEKKRENYYRLKALYKSKTYSGGGKDDNNDKNETIHFEVDSQDMFSEGFAYEAGTELIVEVISVDKGVYNFFEMMDKNLLNKDEEPDNPGNPVSNFTPQVLGYFSAHYSVLDTIKIE